jgi:hypothetical protein
VQLLLQLVMSPQIICVKKRNVLLPF